MPDPRRDPSYTSESGSTSPEWLFKREDQVFGPVALKVLIDLLYRGEISADTQVTPSDDATYQRLGEIPYFLLHVKKAEAQLRVEREVTGVKNIERRQNFFKSIAGVITGLILLAGGGYAAWWLAINKPWQPKSALLEDFGDGIAIAAPARIGSRKHSVGESEVDIALRTRSTSPKNPARTASAAAPTPTPGASGPGSAQRPADGDLSVAQYDQGNIQAVIARETRTLAPCLKAEAKRSDFAGEIPLEFAIGNDGKVAQLWIDHPRFKQGELQTCILRTLQSWNFKSFPGERPTVALSFRIKGR